MAIPEDKELCWFHSDNYRPKAAFLFCFRRDICANEHREKSSSYKLMLSRRPSMRPQLVKMDMSTKSFILSPWTRETRFLESVYPDSGFWISGFWIWILNLDSELEFCIRIRILNLNPASGFLIQILDSGSEFRFWIRISYSI
jgi:hypothetical protein